LPLVDGQDRGAVLRDVDRVGRLCATGWEETGVELADRLVQPPVQTIGVVGDPDAAVVQVDVARGVPRGVYRIPDESRGRHHHGRRRRERTTAAAQDLCRIHVLAPTTVIFSFA